MTDTTVEHLEGHQPALSPQKSEDGKGKRKTTSLPSETVEYLKAWMMSPEHIAHPYPTEQEKAQIMADTGIELKQLTNWFVNNRKRYWKPRVEARLHQQAQAAHAAAQAHAAAVAAVTAASHSNPISPEAGFKPTITLQPNAFLNLDFGNLRQTPVLGPDFSRTLTSRNSCASLLTLHTVSESSSSSASVSPSEDDSSDATPDEEYPKPVAYPVDTKTLEQTTCQTSFEELPPVSEPHRVPESPTKHKLEREVDVTEESPRKKFRRASIDLWRDMCRTASHAYCETLPSLEEATRLFGYTD